MAPLQYLPAANLSKHSATILAIATANPPSCFSQDEYPDFFFRVTNSEHKTQLKDKFKRICQKSMIKKRYLYLTEEILKENPSICIDGAPSIDARYSLLTPEVAKLGYQAAVKTIGEWGRSVSEITHLVFSTMSTVEIPGVDVQLMKLLGLPTNVGRFMLYNHGCGSGGTVLRLAKDLAENNPGARVLVICCEIFTILFHAPSESRPDNLVGQAIFSDGAAAAIVGADLDGTVERPLFQIAVAMQTTLPDTEDKVVVKVKSIGAEYYLSEQLPGLFGSKVKECLVGATSRVGVEDPNSMFYVVHPGGEAILKQVEKGLGLEASKLRASRGVLEDYGNMGGPAVLFILDEMRKTSEKERKATTGEGMEWGVLFSFGPGLMIETILLRSFPSIFVE